MFEKKYEKTRSIALSNDDKIYLFSLKKKIRIQKYSKIFNAIIINFHSPREIKSRRFQGVVDKQERHSCTMINARTFLPGQTEAPLRDKDKCAERRSRETWPFENRIKKISTF